MDEKGTGPVGRGIEVDAGSMGGRMRAAEENGED